MGSKRIFKIKNDDHFPGIQTFISFSDSRLNRENLRFDPIPESWRVLCEGRVRNRQNLFDDQPSPASKLIEKLDLSPSSFFENGELAHVFIPNYPYTPQTFIEAYPHGTFTGIRNDSGEEFKLWQHLKTLRVRANQILQMQEEKKFDASLPTSPFMVALVTSEYPNGLFEHIDWVQHRAAINYYRNDFGQKNKCPKNEEAKRRQFYDLFLRPIEVFFAKDSFLSPRLLEATELPNGIFYLINLMLDIVQIHPRTELNKLKYYKELSRIRHLSQKALATSSDLGSVPVYRIHSHDPTSLQHPIFDTFTSRLAMLSGELDKMDMSDLAKALPEYHLQSNPKLKAKTEQIMKLQKTNPHPANFDPFINTDSDPEMEIGAMALPPTARSERQSRHGTPKSSVSLLSRSELIEKLNSLKTSESDSEGSIKSKRSNRPEKPPRSRKSSCSSSREVLSMSQFEQLEGAQRMPPETLTLSQFERLSSGPPSANSDSDSDSESTLSSPTSRSSIEALEQSFHPQSSNEKVVQTTPETVKKASNFICGKRLKQIHEKIRSASTGISPNAMIDCTHETRLAEISWTIYQNRKVPVWAGKPHSSKSLAETITDFPMLNKADWNEKSRYTRVQNISKIPIDQETFERTLTIEVLADYPSRDPIFQFKEESKSKVSDDTKKGRILIYFSGLRPFLKILQSVDDTPLIPAKADHFFMPHVYLHKATFDDSTGVSYEISITKEYINDTGFVREIIIQMLVKNRSVGSIIFPWHVTSFVLRELKALSKLVKKSLSN